MQFGNFNSAIDKNCLRIMCTALSSKYQCQQADVGIETISRTNSYAEDSNYIANVKVRCGLETNLSAINFWKLRIVYVSYQFSHLFCEIKYCAVMSIASCLKIR